MGIQFARQCQANSQIAECLYRSGDYRPKTSYQILDELNRKALEEHTKGLEDLEKKYA